MGTVANEVVRAERVVENVEDLEELKRVVENIDEADKADLEDEPRPLERIERVQGRELEELPEVRVSVAAELLGLSVPTVNKWTDRGLLEEVAGQIRKVTIRSVLAVRPHVLELRELGKQRNLLEAVLSRIDDQRTLAQRDLRASIADLERGRLTDITPGAPGGQMASEAEIVVAAERLAAS